MTDHELGAATLSPEPLQAMMEVAKDGVEEFAARLRDETVDEGPHVTAAIESYLSLLERGGKRTRAMLAMTGYGIYGGGDPTIVRAASAIVEAQHAYLLVVDDVADAADLRRGGPTAHVRLDGYFQKQTPGENTKKLGEDTAQAAAMVAQYEAQALLMELDAPAENKVTAALVLNKGLARTCVGQTLDLLSVGCEVTTDDIVRVATYKTAFYSYLLPLQLGAALAGAAPEELEQFRDYALHAGFGFQMQDDLIGIFGDEKTTGKSRKSDIVEGKKTLLMAETFRRTTPEQQEILRAALGNASLTDAHFEQCLEIIMHSGAHDYIADMASDSAQKAITHLEQAPSYWPLQHVQFMRDIALYGVQRTA